MLVRLKIALILISAIICGAEEIKLKVYDMHCPPCSCAVQKSISRLEGVIKVRVDPKLHQAIVEFNPEKVDIETIVAATKDIGYPSKLIAVDK